MAHQVKAPLLYPCASRVKMPHVGADESALKHQKPTRLHRPVYKSTKGLPDVNEDYIRKISTDISFGEDVVKDRCFHLVPYSDKYFYEALDVSDIITPPPVTTKPIGRHNNRVADKKHLPCHIKTRSSHKLKPLKRNILERAIEMHQHALAVEEEKAQKEEEERKLEVQKAPAVFLTETLQEEDKEAARVQLQEKKPDNSWDEFLMTKLSETTARWIIAHQIGVGDQQDKLESLVDTYHGPTVSKPELIPDNVSEEGEKEEEVKEDHKWKKGNETLLDRIREMQKELGKPTDPYADDSAAAFYRLPAGVRKAKRNQEKEEQGAINATAHSIVVKPYELPPPPAIKDFMHPEITEMTRFDTTNMYQQEWLTGAEQLHLGSEAREKILLDSNNKYKKALQQESPRLPQTWYPLTEAEKRQKRKDANKVKKFEKGLHRWKSLPEPIDLDFVWESDEFDFKKKGKDTAEQMNLNTPGMDRIMTQSPDMSLRKSTRNNSTLVQIVGDWRSKWHLDMRYADATPDDLIKDMADIHPHIKLKAITTCARAAEYRPPPEPGIQLAEDEKRRNPVKFLPEKLFIALECLLEDEHEQVRTAAAIALYTLEKPVPKAERILRSTLREAKSVDRWTACQCLAYYGECDSEVVGELVYQLLNSEDGIRRERAAFLLAKLSENSMLVHSMLGEQLNSSSWRHRVMSCKVIPKLYGQINKDLVHKLTYLMWNDWHNEVRKAAAQTLGKTCHGKDVHDELREKILSGTERSRVEAISKVGHLGIMTAKLLPALLKCFHDEYVSVRMEACIACNNLQITDDQVVDKLVFIATYDPIWKIKALALQALGNLEKVRSDVRECVLWAFRYEDQPGVRAEACHTLIRLGLRDPEVATILQDRYLVEPNDVVRSEITSALEVLGISPTADMDMVAQIKNEVRKICTRDNICSHITANEGTEEKQANIQRMINLEAENLKKEQAEAEEQKKAAAAMAAASSRPLTSGSRSVSRGRPNPSTPGGASGFGPLSREGTTASEDEEIKNILNRENTQEESCSLPSGGSRPGSRSSAASRRTPGGSSGGEAVDEQDRESAMSQRSRSVVSLKKIKEEEELEQEEGSAGDSAKKREVVLGEKQTYVEVNATGEEDVNDDAFVVRHMSPALSTSDVSAKPTEPSYIS